MDVLIDKDELRDCKIHPTLILRVVQELKTKNRFDRPKNPKRKWQEVHTYEDVRYVIDFRPEDDRDVIIRFRRAHYQK